MQSTHALITLLALTSLPAPAISDPGSPPDPSSKTSSRRLQPGPSTPINLSAPCHPWLPAPQALDASESPHPRHPGVKPVLSLPNGAGAQQHPKRHPRAKPPLPPSRTTCSQPPAFPAHHSLLAAHSCHLSPLAPRNHLVYTRSTLPHVHPRNLHARPPPPTTRLPNPLETFARPPSSGAWPLASPRAEAGGFFGGRCAVAISSRSRGSFPSPETFE